MINWLIIIFTEWLMVIYYFHSFSRLKKSKNSYSENSCQMPILSFNSFTYFEAISLLKTKKNRGVVYLPPETTKTETSCHVEFWGSVLVTLWAIGDEATEKFMSRFCRHLVGGESASECLHRAKKQLRKNGFPKDSRLALSFTLIEDNATFGFMKLRLVLFIEYVYNIRSLVAKSCCWYKG